MRELDVLGGGESDERAAAQRRQALRFDFGDTFRREFMTFRRHLASRKEVEAWYALVSTVRGRCQSRSNEYAGLSRAAPEAFPGLSIGQAFAGWVYVKVITVILNIGGDGDGSDVVDWSIIYRTMRR